MFNCRYLDGGLSVLHNDYSIKCSTDRHAAFELIAAAYVACVSLGIPLYMVRSTNYLVTPGVCTLCHNRTSQAAALLGAPHGATDEGLR